MIVEIRTYTVHHGRMKEYLARYERDGLPIQQEYLGDLIGFYVSEVGSLNEVVHIWRYENMGDREQRRAKMAQDPRWQAFTDGNAGTFAKQENKIMNFAPFSPGRSR